MRESMKLMLLGALTVVIVSRFLPPSTLATTSFGLLLVLSVVLRRRRQLAPVPI